MRAALILVGFGTLAVMEIQSPPRMAKSVDAPLARTVGFAASGDTLTAADRLEISHTQQQASAQQIFSPEPIAPPVQSAAVAQEPPIVAEPPERAAPAGKPAVVLPKPRPKDLPKHLPKHLVSRTTAKTPRAKPIVEAKPCQPGAFDGLFKALNLSLGCQT